MVFATSSNEIVTIEIVTEYSEETRIYYRQYYKV